jgi:hypothetical protein
MKLNKLNLQQCDAGTETTFSSAKPTFSFSIFVLVLERAVQGASERQTREHGPEHGPERAPCVLLRHRARTRVCV